MRRLALIIAVAVGLLVAGCGSPQPHAWLTHPHTRTFSACGSSDCGAYSVTLNWSVIPFAGRTGYYTTVNGTQVGSPTGSPYTFYGLDCGTAFTLGVEAHDGSGSTSTLITVPYTTPACPIFPLQVSSNGRYLETASGSPWLMVGDSPQAAMADLSSSSMTSYLTDRAAHGFNAVQMDLLCDDYIYSSTLSQGCASSGDTYDGIAPFTSGSSPSSYDLSTPNSTYFSRMHSYIAQAEADGLEVLLNPAETGACNSNTWMNAMENNGNGTTSSSTKDYQFGAYLGTYFSDLPNIIWLSGNDFQCWSSSSTDNNDALAVAEGIHSTDPSALQTSELDFNSSAAYDTARSSLDDSAWSSTITLNGDYVYAPTYAGVLHAYNQSATPTFLAEASYDGESNFNTDGCATIRNCRLQEWWTMTSGATGQLYGNKYTWPIVNGWTTGQIDTTAVTQLGYQTSLLSSIAWQTLVPDQSHTLVTAGYGTCPTTGLFASVNCVTDAEAADGKLGLAYLPGPSGAQTITVALSAMSGSITARWYDPTNGTYSAITGSPFTAAGTHSFTPPGTNSAGDSDWVLLLQGS